MKTSAALICLVLVSTACAAASGPRATPGDKLYEAVAGNTVAVVDSASRSTDRKLALGVASADWQHIYSISGAQLVDTDPRTGALLGSLQIGASFRLPAATANGVPGGLSRNGLWLVAEWSDQRTTRMLIIDTTTLTVAHRVNLAGDFEFDAINDAGNNLYLIQHLNGREYYVRLYDVSLGALTENIVVDKSDGNQAMTGLRLSGVPSLGGQWLFSMYVREGEAPFVHALSLDGPFAFCLDLPGSGYGQDRREMRWSLALNATGTRLYAVNPATGTVAEISNGGDGAPAVLRTAHFDPAAAAGGSAGAGAALIAGGTLVAGGPAGIVWIDASSLRVTGRSLPGFSVAGVGLSPDGKSIYAISETGQVAVVSVADRSVMATFDPSAGRPMALMRVTAA